MQKSIFTPEYRTMVFLLREARERRGLTQEEVAKTLQIPATALSRWETAQRRIDLRELALYLEACQLELVEFVQSWEATVKAQKPSVVALKKGRPINPKTQS